MVLRKRFQSPRRRRRTLRRATRGRCQAVGLDGFRLLGERILDISPMGMMVAADKEAAAGEEVMVSFQVPGTDDWVDVEARIARVIEGWRPYDPGYCIGLQFTSIDLATRLMIRENLKGTPPPVPTRRLRVGL